MAEPNESLLAFGAELRRPAPRLELSHPALMDAIRQGRARLGSQNRQNLYPRFEPALPPGAAERLLAEERGER